MRVPTLDSHDRLAAKFLRRFIGTRAERLAADHAGGGYSEWYETDTGDNWVSDGTRWLFDRATASTDHGPGPGFLLNEEIGLGAIVAAAGPNNGAPNYFSTVIGDASGTRKRIDVPGVYEVTARAEGVGSTDSPFTVVLIHVDVEGPTPNLEIPVARVDTTGQISAQDYRHRATLLSGQVRCDAGDEFYVYPSATSFGPVRLAQFHIRRVGP